MARQCLGRTRGESLDIMQQPWSDSLVKVTMLRMAMRISIVIVIGSVLSYWHLMGSLESAMKEKLGLFSAARAEIEGEWLTFLDRKLQSMRTEYLQRYRRLQGKEPAGAFDHWFKLNPDGTAFTRSEHYTGSTGPLGSRYTGFSGGLDKPPALSSTRRIGLVLAMDMLAAQGPGLVQPASAQMPSLTPFVNLYFFTPQKDLVIYWPGTPWYPDYQGGFDLATQGDFSKTINTQLPLHQRDRLWTGTYMDEVPKVLMVSFTMPIDLDGVCIAGLGADISLEAINQRLRKDQFTDASSLIIRKDGLVIAAPSLEHELIATKGDYRLTHMGSPALREAYRLIAQHPDTPLLDDPLHGNLIAVGRIAGPDWLFVTLYPKAKMSSTALQTVGFIVVIGLISLILEAGLLWQVLRNKVARPLQQFIAATDEIAHGKFNPEAISNLASNRTDEIGVLANAFSQMSASLAQASSQQLQANLELTQYRDHLEGLIQQRTELLDKALQQAESANHAKSAFLASISHELRTPLNAVLGFSRLLQREANMPAQAIKKLESINRAGEHLLVLINDVLEISRIESGRATVTTAPFDLRALLESVEDMIRERANAAGLRFEVVHADGLDNFVEGDAPHIRQVLINLLGNAVKYTDVGSIRFSARRHGADMVFEVTDTGPGISTEDQARIFQPFFQTASAKAKGEGTGLGLAISLEYTRIMGGSLQVTSQPGQGSTFSLCVPLPTCSAPLESPKPLARVVGLEPGQTPIRVLVVDDQGDNRELLAFLLGDVGFEVRTVGDGMQAIEVFQSWAPHFIWMDMRMPVMDGYVTTQRIRSMPGGKSVKIAAVTASAFEEDQQRILDAGCEALVRKPIDENALFVVMADLLHLRYRYENT